MRMLNLAKQPVCASSTRAYVCFSSEVIFLSKSAIYGNNFPVFCSTCQRSERHTARHWSDAEAQPTSHSNSQQCENTSKQQPGGFNQHGVSWETCSNWLHDECFELFRICTPNLGSFSISVSMHFLDVRLVFCKNRLPAEFLSTDFSDCLDMTGAKTQKRSKKRGCLRQHVFSHVSAAGKRHWEYGGGCEYVCFRLCAVMHKFQVR